jgi:malonyl-CoA O-methyltransferase
MTNKDIIKENFSRNAEFYDDYSSVQNRTALKLIAGLDNREFGQILDIGCGTGNYTGLLRNKFPSGRIKALDISMEMVRLAERKLRDKGIEFVVADAETETFDEKFDLITSNACFQWFDNLDETVVKYRNVLNQNGIILFSTFGPLTFCELSESLAELYEKNVSISSRIFIDKAGVEEMLAKHFNRVSVADEIIKETYTSLRELLNTIKYTGTRGIGVNCGSIGRSGIEKLENIYKEKFGAVVATYQVFYSRAEKRGLSR